MRNLIIAAVVALSACHTAHPSTTPKPVKRSAGFIPTDGPFVPGSGVGAPVSTTAPLSGTGGTSSPVSLTACSAGQVYEIVGGVWTCTTVSSGGTFPSGTAIVLETGTANTGASFAGSSPTLCSAGFMVTGESIAATGALSQTCTAEMPTSGTALLQASSGSAAAYAGSTGTGCSAGAMATNVAVSASGVVAVTCTAELPASGTALIQSSGGSGVAYAGSTPSACTAGQMDTGPALSATGALTQTCTQEIPASGTTILQNSNGSAVAYAGSTPSACSAGSMTTNTSESSSGVLTNTCTAEMPNSGTALLQSSSGSAAAYAGSTPTACTAGQADTRPTLSAAGVIAPTCTQVINAATSNILEGNGAGAAVASSLSDNGTTVTTAEAMSVAALTASGTAQLNGGANLEGAVGFPSSTISPTDTGTQNNYAPAGIGTASLIRWNGASSITVTGITAGADGRIEMWCNVAASGNSLTFNNESASSTTSNRIETQNGSPITLNGATNGNTCALLVYDNTSSRWRIIAANQTIWTASVALNGGASVAALTVTSGETVSAGNLTLSTATGHISVVGGTTPVLTSCGTSPTIVGSDIAGRIVEGTTATGCIITFGTSYSTAPSCVVTSETQLVAFSYVAAATTITVTNTSASGDVLHYHCDKAS